MTINNGISLVAVLVMGGLILYGLYKFYKIEKEHTEKD